MDKMPGGFFIYQAGGNEEVIYINQSTSVDVWM